MIKDLTIFKAYDIRGIYPTQINENIVHEISQAVYTYLSKKLKKNNLTIAIGHDMRLSSPSLYKVVCDAFVAYGVKVSALGLCATPTVYYSVLKNKYDAGLQISASHNPKQYNGLKMAQRDGTKIIKIARNTGMEDIVEIVKNNSYSIPKNNGAITKNPNMLQKEIADAVSAVQIGDIKNIKVVVDPANAMGILPLEELSKTIGLKLIKMNFTLDGTFPAHQADPLQHSTLVDLQKKVKTEKASLGIALDGDCDRVMFVNEKGGIVPATLITTLVSAEVLKTHPGSLVLVDIRYIRNVADMVTKMGGKVGISKVGHALITKQTNDENAVFAGESSGHYYFRELGGCESPVRVILYILSILAREKKPFSKILHKIQTSIESGEFNFILPKEVKPREIIDKLKYKFAKGKISELDGVAIEFPDWRLSIRSANTEPLLRLNIEGATKEIVKSQLATLKDFLYSFKAILH